MALTIQQVDEGGPADMAGLQSQDRLESINGHSIRDIIDFQFYSADEDLDITVMREGRPTSVHIEQMDEPLGLEFEPMVYRHCGNECIFCFVDQNPRDLRSTLYFKDEDFRLSFMYGNYVTLTNLSKQDLQRIAEQRLSPLYVSIHATDLDVRKRMLGIQRDDRLMEKLQFLADHQIEMHGQIVLCPAINDGEVLDRTLNTLRSLYPALRTIAIVPVGLTAHRHHLPHIQPYDAPLARGIVDQVQAAQNIFRGQLDDPFVYLADEFFLLASVDLPGLDHYGDLCQMENGVGLTRAFLSDFEEAARYFPTTLDKEIRAVIATGLLAKPVLIKWIVPVLNRIQNLIVEIRSVKNQFYGPTVTVSGLLAGSDFLAAFERDTEKNTILLPSNCVNVDGLFLDDLRPQDIEKKLDRRIVILDDFDHFWETL